MTDGAAVSSAPRDAARSPRRLHLLGVVCFWAYVASLLALGAVGVLTPAPELALLYGVDVGELSPAGRTVVLHQLRFLKVFVLAVGVWAVLFRQEIFGRRLHNRLFLGILFAGVAARLLSILLDGDPGFLLLSFTVSEVVFGLGFTVATRGIGGDRG